MEWYSLILPESVNEWMEYFANSKGSTKELLVGTLAATNVTWFLIRIISGTLWETQLIYILYSEVWHRKNSRLQLWGNTSASFKQDFRGENSWYHYPHRWCLLDLYCRMDKQFTPILGNDEAFTFLKTVCSINVKSTELSMDRLCKLFDAEHWYSVKGTQKGEGLGVSTAKMSTVYVALHDSHSVTIISMAEGCLQWKWVQGQAIDNLFTLLLKRPQKSRRSLQDLSGLFNDIYLENLNSRTFL